MRLSEHTYATIRSISSQLLFADHIHQARIGEVVTIVFPDDRKLEGEVLMIDLDSVLIQVFGDCSGLDREHSKIIFSDTLKLTPLSPHMLNRIYNGSFQPLDDAPMFVPEKYAPTTGYPLNPTARAKPDEFIETGFSAIDGLNTLVKGQKLPIFSCAGLPAKEMVSEVLLNSRLTEEMGDFVVIFIALGLTHHEYSFYMQTLDTMSSNFMAFVNLAKDPVVERLLTPRFGLSCAEYLAFEQGKDVLVVMADVTNYCDGLRELSTAREELPGRRGYPGYMYSDLSSLFERAGRIRDIKGSVTMLPVLTMPEDDITHPIPDLTGYITEGQLVLSRELHQQGLFPPVDIPPSLSRLMQQSIGASKTRKDHRHVANQLYSSYAKGVDLRGLEAVVGRDGVSERDTVILDFASDFEQLFIHQDERRTIDETLDCGIRLLQKYSLFDEI